MRTGRNTPKQQVVSLGEVRSNRAYRRLLTELEAFCAEIPDDEPWSIDQFFGPDPGDDEMDALQFAFLDWLAFDYRTWEDGRTILERYTAQTQLGTTEQEMLQAWQRCRIGLYQAGMALGDAILLQDCFTGAEYPVLLDEGIDPFTTGDLVICRVLPVGDTYHLGFDVRTTAADALPLVRQAVERELLFLRRQSPDASWDDLFARRWPVVHDAVTSALAAGAARPEREWSAPPSGGSSEAPAGAPELQRRAAELLQEFLTQDDVSYTDRLSAQRLWWDAAALLAPDSGRAETWAAGAAYAFLHFALDDGTTQSELAHTFGVSVSSLAARARAIADALQLELLDDRYADPLDPRVRFRDEPVSLVTRAVAAAEMTAAADPVAEVVQEAYRQRAEGQPREAIATALPVLGTQPEHISALALLAQCHAAIGEKKPAREYMDRALRAYEHRPEIYGAERKKTDVQRLVEALGALENDDAILGMIGNDELRTLDGPTLRRVAVAASRKGQPHDAMALLELARQRDEALYIVAPFTGALQLMQSKRIPPFKLDYAERLDSLLGWVYKLNALTRAHLVCGIFYGKAKEAVQAVRALGAQRDPWAGKLLRHLATLSDLPKTVQQAVQTELNRRMR